MKRALQIKERTEAFTREGKVKPRYEQHTAVSDFKQRWPFHFVAATKEREIEPRCAGNNIRLGL